MSFPSRYKGDTSSEFHGLYGDYSFQPSSDYAKPRSVTRLRREELNGSRADSVTSAYDSEDNGRRQIEYGRRDIKCYGFHTSPRFKNTPATELTQRALFWGFIKYTTAHGVPHIALSNGWFKAVFWSIVTLAAIGGWVAQSYLVCSTFLNYDTYMTIDIRQASDLTFPAVTVCNQNILRSTELNGNGINITQGRMSPTDTVSANQMPPRQRSTDFVERENLQRYIASLDDGVKRRAGHRRKAFILTCTYDGFDCDDSEFTEFFNWNYGNCFTFNSGSNSSVALRSATQSGVLRGLHLLIDVSTHQYLDTTEKVGARVLVHDQRTMPFPEEEGMDAAVRQSTAIGVRRVDINRISTVNKECSDYSGRNSEVDVFSEVYNWTRYSIKACQKTCLAREVVLSCNCTDYRYPRAGRAFQLRETTNRRRCRSNSAIACLTDVEAALVNGSRKCRECISPCSETYFEASSSSSQWPAVSYQQTILDTVLAKNPALQTRVMQEGINYFNNLLFLEIYYESLNFQEINETQAYELSQFLSDLGGSVGLWLGASVVTVFEWVEYFTDCSILLTIQSLCGHRRKRRSPDRKHAAQNGNHTEKRPEISGIRGHGARTISDAGFDRNNVYQSPAYRYR